MLFGTMSAGLNRSINQSIDQSIFITDALWFDVDDTRGSHDSLPQRTVIKLPVDGSPMKLLLYNSLAHARQTVVRIRVNTSWVQVRDPAGSVIAAQVCRIGGGG